jgi:hypothetical protein
MKPAVVVDTNVPIVANGRAEQAGPACVSTSIRKLRDIHSRHRVLVDRLGLILDEYRRHLSPRGQPVLGDAFFKWLWDNQANPQVCYQVMITPSGADDETFVEFPTDPRLAKFDPSDGKFVATVLACGEQAPIINATDTDWWDCREALTDHGVTVEFLCPELMTRARNREK